MRTPYLALKLKILLASSSFLASTMGVNAEIIRIEDRALVLCATIRDMVRDQRIAESTGALEYNRNCWLVNPPAEVIVLGEYGGIVSLTYRNSMSPDWYGSPAYTPDTWLDGTGATFSPRD